MYLKTGQNLLQEQKKNILDFKERDLSFHLIHKWYSAKILLS